MGQLQVLFEVPRYIEHGLSTGAFQRVGGVIVESGSRRVVAWLRDGSLLETGLKVATSAANPLGAVLQAGQVATSLVDGHLTRRAISAVGQQMAANHLETMQALSSIGRSVQTLTMLTVGGQILNLAMTAATFRAIINRLDKLSESIDVLDRRIQAEFNRERDMRFRVALQAAQDALESQQHSTRISKSLDASLGLFEACENFFKDLDGVLEGSLNIEKLGLANQVFIRAMHAQTSRIRCYMISGDHDLAKQRLSEDMSRFKTYTDKMINLWLGEKSGIYFHRDIPADLLSRFLYVQQWLRGAENGNDSYVMFQIVDEFRSQFWDNSVVDANVVDAFKRNSGIFAARHKDEKVASSLSNR